jgi:hypothetical protein
MRELSAARCGRPGDCVRVSGVEQTEIFTKPATTPQILKKVARFSEGCSVIFQAFTQAFLGYFSSVAGRVLPRVHKTYKDDEVFNLNFYYLNWGQA